MKKLIVFALSLMLLVAMAAPAGAVTPALKIPKMPSISDIKSDIKINITVGSDDDDTVKISENFWDRWFKEHPIVIPSNVIKSR